MSDFRPVISKSHIKKTQAVAKKTQQLDNSTKEVLNCIVPDLQFGTVEITTLSLF